MERLDVVEYLCDYLPSEVIIKHKKIDTYFQLQIRKNGSKGLTLAYVYNSIYMSNKEMKTIGKDESFWSSFRKKYKYSAPMECLYYCEYIRSLPELELALRRCYNYLRKHKFIGKREQNIRKKFKLFSIIDNNTYHNCSSWK